MSRFNYTSTMVLCCYCYIIILILTFNVSAVKRFQYAMSNQNFANTVEISGAIEVTNYASVIMCGAHCAYNSQCVTFFYNNNTGQCILHLKYFSNRNLSFLEIGWNYYVTVNVAERCPETYMYYRYLDFCYRIYSLASVAFPQITAACNLDGGRLAAFESKEKEEYFRQILGNRIYDRVAVGGDRVNITECRLYDGRLLQYFNWMPGEPSTPSALCLQMRGYFQLKDTACGGAQDRTFVCEI